MLIEFTPMPSYIPSHFMFNIYFLFDLINILHEKAGMFSYIIAGRSFTVHAVFIKSGSVYQPRSSVQSQVKGN